MSRPPIITIDLTKIDKKNFNGKNLSLWKMKVEDLLVQNDQSLSLKEFSKKLSEMIDKEGIKLDRKDTPTIHIFLVDFVSFNVAKSFSCLDISMSTIITIPLMVDGM